MEKRNYLSIIVPVYNVKDYLKECLESILKAYRGGIEVIVVDDGSTDNSGEICEEYAKKYDFIKVFHKENGGLSSARNAGINLAKGKYIWFVDSDDYIEDDSIESIIEKVKADKDIIITNYRNILPSGESFYLNEFRKDYDLNIKPYKYIEELGNISYAAVRYITKRSLIVDNNIFFKEGIYHEDEDWTPRILCEAESFTTIEPIVYNYRVGNPNSIIGKLNYKKVLDKIEISKDIYYRVAHNSYSEDMKRFLETRIAHNYIAALNEYSLYSGKERRILKEELQNSKYLLDNLKCKKSIMVKISLRTIGVLLTSKVLILRNALMNN